MGRCKRLSMSSSALGARRPGLTRSSPAKELARSGNGSADAEARETQTRTQTVRVSVDTLEHLMTTVSELVLTRNQLLDLVRRTGESEFKSPLQRLSTVTAELQEGIMKARMQPIANAWQKLPRLVRELSLELDKKIELDMTGGETELDRQVLEMIKDPLTHMVRNSADHGLEPPAERAKQGKPETGRIKLSAYQQGGYIVIEVADDGRGLDAQKIRAKALENGLATQAELDRLSDCRRLQVHLQAGLFHGGGHQRRVGPRRRHGRRAHQYRADRRHRRAQVDLARGHHFHHQDSADARDHGGPDRRGRGPPLRHSAIQRDRAGPHRQSLGSQVELINETAVLRLRDKLLPLLDLAQLLQLEGSRATLERVANGVLTVVVIQVGARLSACSSTACSAPRKSS